MKVIGIGASAGGLEAITRLVSKLSDGSGAAFVFLQHLSPNTKSMIGELLEKHTSMPVTMVYKDQPVRANHIYVMAENKNIVFSNGVLLTKDRALPWIFNVLIDTIVEYAESVDPERKASEISALKLDLESDATNHQHQLSRLERAIERHFIVHQVPIAETVVDDTKLQQSVMALRARMKINQVLMPQ